MHDQYSGNQIALQGWLHTGQAPLRKFDALKAASGSSECTQGNVQGSLLTVTLSLSQWLFDISAEGSNIIVGVGLYDVHQLLHRMDGFISLVFQVVGIGFT